MQAHPVSRPPAPSALTIDRPAVSMDFRARAGSIWIRVLMTSMGVMAPWVLQKRNRERRREGEGLSDNSSRCC